LAARVPPSEEPRYKRERSKVMGEGREDVGADEPAADRPPASSETDDPDLVLFLTVATVIFAALWFCLSLIAGAL
jgi:hypothetical protein